MMQSPSEKPPMNPVSRISITLTGSFEKHSAARRESTGKTNSLGRFCFTQKIRCNQRTPNEVHTIQPVPDCCLVRDPDHSLPHKLSEAGVDKAEVSHPLSYTFKKLEPIIIFPIIGCCRRNNPLQRQKHKYRP